MKTVKTEELVEILKNSTAETVYLNTETAVKMNKRNNPLITENVTKVTKGEFEFGEKSYNERVNESFDSSLGTVHTKPLPWGKWLDGAEGKVIVLDKYDKKGEFVSTTHYLRYYNAVGDLEISTLVNGHEATEDEMATIKEFSSKKSSDVSTYTTDTGNVVETKLKTNVVAFNNIKSIEIDGETYCLEF